MRAGPANPANRVEKVHAGSRHRSRRSSAHGAPSVSGSPVRWAVHLAERWLKRTTDEGLQPLDLERLVWQLVLTRPSLGVLLIRLMLISAHDDVRTRAGQLAALISLRQPDILSDGGIATAESLLRTALQNTATRKGVATLLAELVDELPENTSRASGAHTPVRSDRQLLIASSTTTTAKYAPLHSSSSAT